MLSLKGFQSNKRGYKTIRRVLDLVLTFLGLFLYSTIMLLLISFILNSIIYLTFYHILLLSLVIAFLGTIGRALYGIKKS